MAPNNLISGALYKIISVQSGKVLSLSPTEITTVEALRDINADYQIWRAEDVGDGWQWALRCLKELNGKPLYLSWPGTEPYRGLPLVGSSHEKTGWDIKSWETHGGAEHRIWVHGAPSPGTVVDLKDGSPEEGATIQLWASNNTASQFWLFQETKKPSN
ncbi:hypothetical protein AN958_11791 [Leucoagaricus sp. SymC.cos]|nr:hypothetical protein AN958_11791 [Leucoagaricus sp. SymC.cos]